MPTLLAGGKDRKVIESWIIKSSKESIISYISQTVGREHAGLRKEGGVVNLMSVSLFFKQKKQKMQQHDLKRVQHFLGSREGENLIGKNANELIVGNVAKWSNNVVR